jgi:nonsense-mediated mRNA decay protein 3
MGENRKKPNNYFEAILQLRNPSSGSFKTAVDDIYEAVENSRRDGVFISKEEKVKGGIDFYISSKKFSTQLGIKLNESYGGVYSVNPRLFSRDRQTSKDIYRLSILVRLPDFEKGSILKFGNELFQVTSFQKNTAIGVNLRTKKKTSLDLAQDYEIIANEGGAIHAIVTKHKPFVEVLDPETYQSMKVENCHETKKEKLKIIVDNGRAYAVE